MDQVDSDLIVPKKSPKRPINPWTDYDEDSDTLMLYFFGPPEPALSYRMPNDRFLYLRLSFDDYQTIGVQIEGFVSGFLGENPQFIELARAVGVSEDILEEIEQGVDQSAVMDRSKRFFAHSLKAEIDERELVTAD